MPVNCFLRFSQSTLDNEFEQQTNALATDVLSAAMTPPSLLSNQADAAAGCRIEM
jgi:hypothetical protein